MTETSDENRFTRTRNTWIVLICALCAWLGASVWAYRVASFNNADVADNEAARAAEVESLAAKNQATEEDRHTAEQQADELAHLTTEQQTAKDALLAAEQQAEEEARLVAEQQAEEEARLAAEQQAEEEARLAAEQAAEEEARLAAEQAAEEEARLAAEQAAEEEARLAAEQAAEEQARLAVEQAAEEEEARLAAEQAAEEEARLAAEQQAEEQLPSADAQLSQVAEERLAEEKERVRDAARKAIAAAQAKRAARLAELEELEKEEQDLPAQEERPAAIDTPREEAAALQLAAQRELWGRVQSDLTAMSSRLQFEGRSEVISAQVQSVLDGMFDPLSEFSDIPVLVVVNTNEFRGPADNNRLSRTRGRSIVDYMVGRGLTRSRFRVEAGNDGELPYGSHIVSVLVEESAE